MNILTVGLVSSGKSSFINSIAGGFICNVSILKETINPTKFLFSKNGIDRNLKLLADFLKTIKESNKHSLYSKYVDNTYFSLPLPWNFKDFSIVDLPGFDTSNINETFTEYLAQTDVVAFITDVTKSFTTEMEINLFNSIKNEINKQHLTGNIVDLVVIMNKYDNLDDDDFGVNYEKTKEIIGNIPVFRYSAHSVLLEYSAKNNRKLYVPDIMKKEFDNKIKKKLHSSGQLITSDNNYYTITSPDSSNVHGDYDGLLNYFREITDEEYMNNKEYNFMKYCYNELLKIDINYLIGDYDSIVKFIKSINFDTKMTYGLAHALIDYINFIFSSDDVNVSHNTILFKLLEIVFHYLVNNNYYSDMLTLANNCIQTIGDEFTYLTIPIRYVIENYDFSISMNEILNFALTNENFYCESTQILAYNKENKQYYQERINLIKLAIDKKRLENKIHKLLSLHNLNYKELKYVVKLSPKIFNITSNPIKYSGNYYVNNIIHNIEYRDIFGIYQNDNSLFHMLMKPMPRNRLLTIIDELN